MYEPLWTEVLVIDTPEAARNLEAAYEDFLKNGPYVPEGPSIEDKLREGREFLKANPNWLNEAAEAARKRIIARGEEVPHMTEEEWAEYIGKT
jgi:exonuclease III